MSLNKAVALKDIFPVIKEQLDSGGSASFISHGTSMKPLLRDGRDTVFLVKPGKALKKMDIIFYRRDDGTFVLHRIVGIKNGVFTCRGDNQFVNEYNIAPESVIAVLSHYEKNGKKKSAASFPFRLYSFFWVNSVYLRKFCVRFINFLRGVKK